MSHRSMVTVQAGYLQTCQWEPPPLWRFRGGAASVERREPFSSPATETGAEHQKILKQNYQELFTPECCYASVCSTVTNTYFNEVFGVEDIRDLIAKEIFFGSSKTLDVDMLDNHLQNKDILPSWSFHPRQFALLFVLSMWKFILDSDILTFVMQILSLWHLFYHYSWILPYLLPRAYQVMSWIFLKENYVKDECKIILVLH